MTKVTLEVTNRGATTLVVGNNILQGKQTAKVSFTDHVQLISAQTAETNKQISLATPITPEMIAQVGGPAAAAASVAAPMSVSYEEEAPVVEEATEPEEAVINTEDGLTAEEVDSMTMAQIKEYATTNNIEIASMSTLSAAELKVALKEALNLV